MKTNVTNPNKKVFRVILAAAAVLILCGAFCGAAAATDLTANLSTNSIVEKVTIHNVDTSQGQMYGLNLTASSRLWEDSDVEMMMKSDLYIKPFKLEITCNRTIIQEPVTLTIQFKVNETKMKKYDDSGDYQVRLAHKISDKNWELLPVTKVTSVPSDGNLHYNVTAQEPTPLFAIVVMKETVTGVDSDGWATLGEKGKMTIISSESSIASDVKLTAVSGLNTGDKLSFNKLSDNNPLLFASLKNHKLPEGYISQKIISLFAVETTTKPNVNPVMHMEVTVNDGYTPDNIKVIHFKDGKWEDNYLSSTHSGKTYEVPTDGFSPFAVVYAEPKEKPTPAPKSSTSQGTSIWLTATPTPTPIAEATAEPTQPQPVASPINQPPAQTSTPVPVAGILTGLGAGLAVMALRRR